MSRFVKSLARPASSALTAVSAALLSIAILASASAVAKAAIDCGPPTFGPPPVNGFTGCSNPGACFIWQQCNGYTMIDPLTGKVYYYCQCA